MTNDLTLSEQVAENMAIYAGQLDHAQFMAQAVQLVRTFEAIEGRPPHDYLEIENWSHDHLKFDRFLVIEKIEPGL